VQTTGLYAKGKIVPDLEYSTRGAPCHNVIGKALCHYSDHLQEMFPDDALLGEMGAQSYLGIPLTDSAGKPLGLMALLDTKPMPEAQLATAILQIAGVRVAGEMERLAKVEELQWKTALLEAQMEAAPDGILMIDTQGRRVLQNQRMNDLLKIPPHISADEDIRLQIEFVASRAKDPRKMKDKIAYFYAHPEQISRDELEFVDGTIVDRYSSPVRNKNGGCCGRIWTFRDVTHARQLEAQLRQSQKMEAIGQLAGGVAHDFNNILASLIMQADLLEMAEFLPAEVTTGLQQIRADAMRAAQLTRQLLLFSRRQVMQSCRLDLNEVVTNLAKMLQRIIGEDVRLQLNLHPVPLMTCADAGMVEQVLLNLAVNARDAMPKGGRLTIVTNTVELDDEAVKQNSERRAGNFVSLAVTDTGQGMDEGTLKRIFEPFFTTKEVGKGTGLGLPTAHGIIKQHQGWIEVQSQPARGSTFAVYLPAKIMAPIAPEAPAGHLPVLGGCGTLLLVEDEEIVRRPIGTYLRKLGYQVIEAATGNQALALWRVHRDRIDLLYTDMVMPEGVTGLELAEKLQREKPSLQVIISSGYSTEISMQGVPADSGYVYLPKPSSSSVIAATIRNCLGGK
jgi:signal transduction histidine kinase